MTECAQNRVLHLRLKYYWTLIPNNYKVKVVSIIFYGTSQARRRQLRASSGGSSDATSIDSFPLHNTEARQHQGNLDVTSDVVLSCCCCPSAGADFRVFNSRKEKVRAMQLAPMLAEHYPGKQIMSLVPRKVHKHLTPGHPAKRPPTHRLGRPPTKIYAHNAFSFPESSVMSLRSLLICHPPRSPPMTLFWGNSDVVRELSCEPAMFQIGSLGEVLKQAFPEPENVRNDHVT